MSDKRACRININYKTFSDTGDRVLKEDSVVSVGISCKLKMENLFLAKSEIDDYFSENPILGISDVDDLKSCLSMIRELRVKFKKSMFEVKSDMGEDKFVAMCPFCKELLNQASDYIIQANERVKVLREGEAKKADDLAEKIRLAEIAEKQRLEKKADDLAEKVRLEEMEREEKVIKKEEEMEG